MVKVTGIVTYEPQRWRHRRTIVEGIDYDGAPACAAAIVEWSHGKFEPDDDGRLSALTPDGKRYVTEGDTAVIGVCGEPYMLQPLVRKISYELLDATDYRAVLTTARVRELHEQSRATFNGDKLHAIVDQLVAALEASMA